MSVGEKEERPYTVGEVKNFVLVQIERQLFHIADLVLSGKYEKALKFFDTLQRLLPPEVKRRTKEHFERLRRARQNIQRKKKQISDPYQSLYARRRLAVPYREWMLETIEAVQDALYETQLRVHRFTGVDLSKAEHFEEADFEVEPKEDED